MSPTNSSQTGSISIDRLAKQMRFRKRAGSKPYLLLLGAGVSISSGVSKMDDMIDRFLIDFGEVNDKILTNMDLDERFEKFVSKMETLNQDDRYFWLQDGFKDVEPSAGYLALTRLIEADYFDTIFTTNWDIFLDMSLDRSPILKNKRDYRFYVRGIENNDFIIRSFQEFTNPKIKILKLHGELDSRVTFVTPKETNSFPKEIAELIKTYFKDRHLMMIGYSVTDEDVRQCIEPNQNTLIYVNPKIPSDKFFLYLTSRFKQVLYISDQEAKFDDFMSKLSKAVLDEDSETPLDWLAQINTSADQIRGHSERLISHLRKNSK